jgi:hypothetical protein
MTDRAPLRDAVETALTRLPAVRRIYPAVGPGLLRGRDVRPVRPEEGSPAATGGAGPAVIEVAVGLDAGRPAGPAALQALTTIRALLDGTGRADVTVRLRIASID